MNDLFILYYIINNQTKLQLNVYLYIYLRKKFKNLISVLVYVFFIILIIIGITRVMHIINYIYIVRANTQCGK